MLISLCVEKKRSAMVDVEYQEQSKCSSRRRQMLLIANDTERKRKTSWRCSEYIEGKFSEHDTPSAALFASYQDRRVEGARAITS